ncbi:hypothetical protein C0991_002838 [Blastosporella zonata]|nr:hypothetical protein C0991_002838 [Blastosporella zonata]
MVIATPAEPGKTYVTFLAILNHPVSRGTIHAKSNDPEDLPEIDPHYFEKDSGSSFADIALAPS